MRTAERDLLLMILAISAGSADGWSYFGLGHAFVANMTGNTVLMGMAVFGHSEVLHPAISLACYAVGVMLAAVLTREVRQGVTWPRSISATLLLESIVITGCEVAWVVVAHHSQPATSFTRMHDFLLGCMAFAIGLQSGAMLQLRIPGIVTTYISGTWTSVMSGAARLASGKPSGPRRKRLTFEERVGMQAAILVVYFLSAVLTGWILRYVPAAVGAIPAVSVLIVAILGLVHHTSAPRFENG